MFVSVFLGKKLRDVQQEREGAISYQVFLSSHIKQVSTVSRATSSYLGYLGLSRTIPCNLGLSQTILDNLGQSQTVSDYLGLSCTITDYLGLSGTISNYLGLS